MGKVFHPLPYIELVLVLFRSSLVNEKCFMVAGTNLTWLRIGDFLS